jgi:hypothetical protein
MARRKSKKKCSRGYKKGTKVCKKKPGPKKSSKKRRKSTKKRKCSRGYKKGTKVCKKKPGPKKGSKKRRKSTKKRSRKKMKVKRSPSMRRGRYSPMMGSRRNYPKGYSPMMGSRRNYPKGYSPMMRGRYSSGSVGSVSPSAFSIRKGRYSPSMMSGRYSPSMMRGRYSPSMTGGRYSPSMMGGRYSPSMMGGRYSPSMMGGRYSPSMRKSCKSGYTMGLKDRCIKVNGPTFNQLYADGLIDGYGNPTASGRMFSQQYNRMSGKIDRLLADESSCMYYFRQHGFECSLAKCNYTALTIKIRKHYAMLYKQRRMEEFEQFDQCVNQYLYLAMQAYGVKDARVASKNTVDAIKKTISTAPSAKRTEAVSSLEEALMKRDDERRKAAFLAEQSETQKKYIVNPSATTKEVLEAKKEVTKDLTKTEKELVEVVERLDEEKAKAAAINEAVVNKTVVSNIDTKPFAELSGLNMV